MCNILVYIYTTEKQINQFSIFYMLNPTLHVNKLFIEQVEKCLRSAFHKNTMGNIIDVMRKKYTCIISLIIFYESKTINPVKLYRVLSCVLYSIIYNYICIDYLCFQSKTLNSIYYDKIFEKASYNILLGIGIT